jgi:hypothetical protein
VIKGRYSVDVEVSRWLVLLLLLLRERGLES